MPMDLEHAVEAATDALEVFFNVEEPVAIIPRHQIANIAAIAVRAAWDTLNDGSQEGS